MHALLHMLINLYAYISAVSAAVAQWSMMSPAFKEMDLAFLLCVWYLQHSREYISCTTPACFHGLLFASSVHESVNLWNTLAIQRWWAYAMPPQLRCIIYKYWIFSQSADGITFHLVDVFLTELKKVTSTDQVSYWLISCQSYYTLHSYLKI